MVPDSSHLHRLVDKPGIEVNDIPLTHVNRYRPSHEALTIFLRLVFPTRKGITGILLTVDMCQTSGSCASAFERSIRSGNPS